MTTSAYTKAIPVMAADVAERTRPQTAPPLPPPVPGAEIDAQEIARQAARATKLLKSLANPHRLMILCHLVDGEQSVGALERQLGMQQAHLSQQLARLRQDGLVRTRRESRTIYYSLGSAEAAAVLALLYRMYCSPSAFGRAEDAAMQQE